MVCFFGIGQHYVYLVAYRSFRNLVFLLFLLLFARFYYKHRSSELGKNSGGCINHTSCNLDVLRIQLD